MKGLSAAAEGAAADDYANEVDAIEPAGTTCQWLDMQIGNATGKWHKDQSSIKYAYDHNLKGREVRAWWPGRAKLGECNNLGDKSRGCWYRAKLLNDPSCTTQEHCLHLAAHDGEPSHTFTCPSWLENPDGARCGLPQGWQACPTRFRLKRWESGVPDEFKTALATTCDSEDQDHCSGPVPDRADLRYYFDLHRNMWYRCTPWLRCEEYEIKRITVPPSGVCGDKHCDHAAQCFEHPVSSARSTYHCVKDADVLVISDGDDVMKSTLLGLEYLATTVLPRTGRRRARRPAHFL